MKHLLYLNRDYLYSYYAQAFEGLEQSRQKEVSDLTATKEDHISEVETSKAEFSFQVPQLLKIGAGHDITDESLNTHFVTLEAAREVATVTLHDNALNEIIITAEQNPIQIRLWEAMSLKRVTFQFWICNTGSTFCQIKLLIFLLSKCG